MAIPVLLAPPVRTGPKDDWDILEAKDIQVPQDEQEILADKVHMDHRVQLVTLDFRDCKDGKVVPDHKVFPVHVVRVDPRDRKEILVPMASRDIPESSATLDILDSQDPREALDQEAFQDNVGLRETLASLEQLEIMEILDHRAFRDQRALSVKLDLRAQLATEEAMVGRVSRDRAVSPESLGRQVAPEPQVNVVHRDLWELQEAVEAPDLPELRVHLELPARGDLLVSVDGPATAGSLATQVDRDLADLQAFKVLRVRLDIREKLDIRDTVPVVYPVLPVSRDSPDRTGRREISDIKELLE